MEKKYPVYFRNGLDASASIRIKKRIFSFLVLLPVIMLFIVCVTVHFDLKKTFARDQACLMSCFIFSCQEYNVKKQSIQTSNSVLMYRSNRSFNMPPRATPRAFDFFENYCSNSPTTRAKMPFKCPTLGSIQVIKCPHRGDISQAQK